MLWCLSIRVWRIFWTSSRISLSGATDIRSSGSKNEIGNVVENWTVRYFVPTCNLTEIVKFDSKIILNKI